MTFAWNERKASRNLRKHGVGFREAATVFEDQLSATFPDDEHSLSERRLITVGQSALGRLRGVAHTEADSTIRIIRARQMTPRERKFYEKG